jgi:hypothetical protein
MKLEKKELCGKNVFFIKKKNRFSMYANKKKIGEIALNENGSVVKMSAYNKKYVKNMIFFINTHKELVIEDIKGFPLKHNFLSELKERLTPDTLLHYAILANSTSLARYAIEREAKLTRETFINAAIYSTQLVEIHFKDNLDFIEEAMEAAFEHKNYTNIRILAKKTKNLEKYIEMCNKEEKYQVIKKDLIKIFVKIKSSLNKN